MERRGFFGRLGAVVLGLVAASGLGRTAHALSTGFPAHGRRLGYNASTRHWIVAEDGKQVAEGFGLETAPQDLVTKLNLCDEYCQKVCANCKSAGLCHCWSNPCDAICLAPIKQ